jgi:AcrR family transcriptional regulator
MKDTILQKAGEIFLRFGFKSVTMDDIANELAISKKTIYKYFKNKEILVDESLSHLHQCIHNTVSCICVKGFNAIQENFEIKKTFKDLFKNTDDSPMYQLQKYYPKTYKKLMADEFCMFKDFIQKNIEKGIEEGLYRKDINVETTIKFYFSLVMSVHDTNLYSYNKNTINKLEMMVLEYHTRAIATQKGIKILDEQLEQNA